MQEYRAGNKKIKISNPDKILFPDIDFNKSDLVDYYAGISRYMLRHLKDRPINMKRAPDGVAGESFYQQSAGNYFPSWVDKVEVIKKDGEKIIHVVCNDKKTLVFMSNLACITIHIWLSRTDNIKYPDKMIFDLDPPRDGGFDQVRTGALRLKEYFDKYSIESFVMTTGSKGLHVVIPIKPKYGFDIVRGYARRVGEQLSQRYPGSFTVEQSREKRKGRLFMDYMRNSYGITSVCPYSIRLFPEAPVAVPLDWKELEDNNVGARSWTVKNIFRRLGHRDDPWKGIYRHRIDIGKYIKNEPGE